MLWALQDQQRIAPTPKQSAVCPGCGEPVLSKCGPIMTWHWAHKTNSCPWNTEPETEWHRAWKQHFPDDWQEVKYGDNRADILTPARVVEIQNSPISADTVREREAVYGNMIWIVNGAKFENKFKFSQHWWDEQKYLFRWLFPRKSWWAAEAELYIDFSDTNMFDGDLLFRIIHMNNKIPCRGYGKFVKKQDLIDILLADVKPHIPIPKCVGFGDHLRQFTCDTCGVVKTWRRGRVPNTKPTRCPSCQQKKAAALAQEARRKKACAHCGRTNCIQTHPGHPNPCCWHCADKLLEDVVFGT